MSTKVPFMDLNRIHAPIKDEILSRIGTIIDRSGFILGSEVEAFEKDFAAYVGSSFALGVANGLDALKLALQSVDIGPGDEVITAANTFAATAFAISAVGARPVFAEIEEKSYNIDPRSVEKLITPKTKAIIPVHLYGQPASMGPLIALADKHGLKIVEDCAQSHGATYENKNTGTMGILGCFSFYPGKNLGAMGDGGAITTSNPEVFKKLKILRDVGQSEKYHHTVIGHNSRLDAIQASILAVKLKHLKSQTEDRVRVAKRYREVLSGINPIVLPDALTDRTHVYHLYVIHTKDSKDRDLLKNHLNAAGVQTGLHYPIPLHLQKCYSSLGYKEGSFPIAEKSAKSLLSLPIFPGMTDIEINSVATEIKSYFKC